MASTQLCTPPAADLLRYCACHVQLCCSNGLLGRFRQSSKSVQAHLIIIIDTRFRFCDIQKHLNDLEHRVAILTREVAELKQQNTQLRACAGDSHNSAATSLVSCGPHAHAAKLRAS